MADCPICETKINENAKFCQECGVRLSSAVNERAWIVAMQERIRSIRHSGTIYSVVAIIGLLTAILIPFLMRFVLLYTMDMVSWTITAVGAVLFIGGMVAGWLDERRIKSLILVLQQGQPAAEAEPESVATD